MHLICLPKFIIINNIRNNLSIILSQKVYKKDVRSILDVK